MLLKVDPLSANRNNELIAQGEELEASAELRVFVPNISSPHLKRRYRRYVFLFLVFPAFRTSQHVHFFLCTSGELLVSLVTSPKTAAKETSGLCVLKGLKVHILNKEPSK